MVSQYTALDKEVLVTLEMADGTAWSGKAMFASISAQPEYYDVPSLDSRFTNYKQARDWWTMELQGIGDLSFIHRNTLVDRVVEQQSATEWLCGYCGAAMPKASNKCSGCGGFRSFIYDI